MMTNVGKVAALVLVLAACQAVTAAEPVSVEDVIKIHKSGVGENLLFSIVEKSPNAYDLTADQIIALKTAGVPEDVINAMLRKAPVVNPNPPLPATRQAAQEPYQDMPTDTVRKGQLSLENVDNQPWGWMLDSANQTIRILPEAERMLVNQRGITFTLPVGTYAIRYNGSSEPGQQVEIAPDSKALAILSRITTPTQEGLYISTYQDGQRVGGRQLTILIQRSNNTSPVQTVSTQSASSSTDTVYLDSAQYKTPEPKEREVEVRYVERPSTVVYTSPVVYPTYYPSYYYSRPYYYGCGYRPYYGHYHGYRGHGGYYRGCGSGGSVRVGFGFRF
jgi:hypothetical protein